MVLENDLGRDNIKTLVFRLAIPAMFAQFVNILYSIVDRIYVANIPVVGKDALAALGICAPIMTLVGSFSTLVGIGGATIVSIRLGEGDNKGARDILSNALTLLLIISSVLTVGVLAFKTPILYAFGADSVTFPHANEYFTLYMLGTIFAIVGTGLNQFIMCQGFAKKAMLAVILGAVANIILDPIFIFLFKMGVSGAAIATVISQGFTCLYVLKFLSNQSIPVPLSIGRLQKNVVKTILKTGFNPFVIIATDNVILIAMNVALSKYGGAERGVMLLASSTVLQSFMSIVSMPMIGITSGTQPILGYNYGARKSDRVLAAEKYTFMLAASFSVVMFIIAQTIPHLFAQIFLSDPVDVQTAATAIRMYTLGLIPMSIQYTVVDGFTGIGAIKVSVTLSLFRKTLFLLSVLLIPLFFDIMNVFYAETISDIIAGFTSGLAFHYIMKKVLRQREVS